MQMLNFSNISCSELLVVTLYPGYSSFLEDVVHMLAIKCFSSKLLGIRRMLAFCKPKSWQSPTSKSGVLELNAM